MQGMLRAYQPSDHDALAAMFYQIRKEEFPWTDHEHLSAADFDRSTDGERIIVAEVQGKTAGFLSVWEPDRFIHNLFVDREYRHAGIGRQLIRWALSQYGTPLSLKCAAANTAALKFYQSGGWQTDGEGSGEEGLYYLLSLRKSDCGSGRME